MTDTTLNQVPILVNQAHAAMVELEAAIEEALFGDVARYEAEQQIEALDKLIEARRGTFPLTYAEIKAIGPAAVKEWSRRQIARALALHAER